MYYSDKAYPTSFYQIIYVTTLLLFTVLGTLSAKIILGVFDVTFAREVVEADGIIPTFLALARTETATAVELAVCFFAPLTVIPTAIQASVLAYRGLALGWCIALYSASSSVYAGMSVGAYAVATALTVIFLAESSGEAPYKQGAYGRIKYAVGFLVMSAAVFAVELIPKITNL